jgi:hypothetical protein
MNLSITAEARDTLYEHILGDLSGIGDVWTVVCAENFEAADRLGRQYSDELRLILDDLGWGEGTGQSVELTTSPDVLQRVFPTASQLRQGSGRQRAATASRSTGVPLGGRGSVSAFWRSRTRESVRLQETGESNAAR